MHDQSPNAIALLALGLWPVAALALAWALGPARGAVAAMLWGYLLLPPAPAGFDLPLLPPLTKDSIPSLAALVAMLALSPSRPRLLPVHPGARALLLLFFLAPCATILANPDPVFWGSYGLPGLQPREAVGIGMAQAILVLPFLLGRALLGGEGDARGLLSALAWAGLAYSLPMLLEVRLAPQLNIWIYGFFQHSFEQMMRGDGFRPIVFLYHGLWAAFFAMSAAAAALALGREALAERRGPRAAAMGVAALWLLGTLVLCKSAASLAYALLLAPLLLLLPARLQLTLACLMALVPLAYPVAKATGLVPTATILQMAEDAAGEERANSLRFRMDTEDVLLARAEERPLFGWGLWSRNLILEEDTGRHLTIPDGRWILLLGMFGWLGLVSSVGLMALPVWLARGAAGAAGPPRAVAALALIHAVNLIDLVPNATETSLTWLVAGALLGWAERQRQTAPADAPTNTPRPAARSLPLRPAFETIL